MGAVTSIVMMGMAVAGAVAANSASRQQAKRAEAQGEISARQGELELRRSAKQVAEAKLELEDAKNYQQWKDDFVLPAMQKSLSDPRQGDPAQMKGGMKLAQGIQIEGARDQIAQGVTNAGFDFGGSRHGAADSEVTGATASADLATGAAAHEAVKQQGISNTGALINQGRQVFKQQGII